MDTLRLDNVLKEIDRVANIVFKYGSGSDLERLTDTLNMLSGDAEMHRLERLKGVK